MINLYNISTVYFYAVREDYVRKDFICLPLVTSLALKSIMELIYVYLY